MASYIAFATNFTKKNARKNEVKRLRDVMLFWLFNFIFQNYSHFSY